jgi:hypothetical protein
MTFKDNGFQVIKNFLEPDFVEFIQDYFAMKANCGDFNSDTPQVVGSYEWYSDAMAETILQNSCQAISTQIGINILPTYSFTRLYLEGDVLEKHIDRPECEISATLSLGYSNNGFINPIYFSKDIDENDAKEILLTPGDLCVYSGCTLYHWRPPIKNKWLLQTFLHFVNSEGIYKNKIYDSRPYLGFSKDSKKLNDK